MRELNINESLLIAEEMRKSDSEGLGLAGVTAIEDVALNRILEIKRNKLTLRGRTFALEKLFRSPPPAASGYHDDPYREIIMFRIGSGGAPAAQPFNPTPPSAEDVDMAKPIPFRVIGVDDEADIPANIYLDQRPLTGEDEGKIGLFSKRFETLEPEFVWNPVDNKVYKHIRLLIDSTDAREQAINEAGLVIARPDNFEGAELFSRVTFASEYMASETEKGLLIHYYVYA